MYCLRLASSRLRYLCTGMSSARNFWLSQVTVLSRALIPVLLLLAACGPALQLTVNLR